jgi:hypothetical protein
LTNAYNNDLRICAILPSKKDKDSVFFYSYDLDKIKKGIYQLEPKYTWKVKRYRNNIKDNNELYSLIKAGKKIEDAIIDTLDLTQLTIKEKNNWVITYPLSLAQVYIKAIKFPQLDFSNGKIDQPDDKNQISHLIFKGKVTLFQCSINNIDFNNTIFENDVSLINNSLVDFGEPSLSFNNAKFKKKLKLINDYAGQMLVELFMIAFDISPSDRDFINSSGTQMFKAFYKDDDMFGSSDMKLPKYQFQGSCEFDDEVVLLNNNPFIAFDFSNGIFKNKTYLSHYYPRYYGKKKIKYPEYNVQPDLFKYYPLCNINFYSAKFEKPVYLNNEWLKNIDFSDAVFSDTLNLFNTVVKDSLKITNVFFHSHFSSKQVIVVNPVSFSLLNLNFNSASIRDLEFPYYNYNKTVHLYSPSYLDNYVSFYDRLIIDAKQTYLQQNDLFSDLQNKYKHQKILHKITFLKHNFNPVNGINYIWLSFLELTVGNGYNGGSRFFYSCLIMILIFSIIYFVFSREEFVSYINNENGALKNDETDTMYISYEPKSYLRNFFKCFWQSFNIFFNPKYNFKYFQFSNKLFIPVIIEWLLGILMIILFLIYIATTYPFIRALLGI